MRYFQKFRECLTRKNFWYCIREYLWTVLGGVVIGGAVMSYVSYTPDDPIDLISAEIVETCTTHDGVEVKGCLSGERMRISYHVKWNERCPVYVDIFIFKDGIDQEIVYRNGPIRAAFEEGDQKWVREVFIPPQLPTGNYIYRARLTGKCKRGEYPLAIPDMPFMIRRP